MISSLLPIEPSKYWALHDEYLINLVFYLLPLLHANTCT